MDVLTTTIKRDLVGNSSPRVSNNKEIFQPRIPLGLA
jgi:hypothetical protein